MLRYLKGAHGDSTCSTQPGVCLFVVWPAKSQQSYQSPPSLSMVFSNSDAMVSRDRILCSQLCGQESQNLCVSLDHHLLCPEELFGVLRLFGFVEDHSVIANRVIAMNSIVGLL
jgi:hypothetical protein